METKFSGESTGLLRDWRLLAATILFMASFLIGLFTRWLGVWSGHTSTLLLFAGLCVCAVLGLRGEGPFGRSRTGSWLLMLYAVWPVLVTLVNWWLLSAALGIPVWLSTAYAGAAVISVLVALLGSIAVGRSLRERSWLKWLLAVFYALLAGILVLSWLLMLTGGAEVTTALVILHTLQSAMTEAIPALFCWFVVWFASK